MKQLHEIAIGGISKGGRAARQRAARKNGRSAYPFLVPSAYGKLKTCLAAATSNCKGLPPSFLPLEILQQANECCLVCSVSCFEKSRAPDASTRTASASPISQGHSGRLRLDRHGVEAVLKPESFPIEMIYVPVKRRKALKAEIVQQIAESILEIGQQAPIQVRPDEGRLVLVEGLHRLEACKALGEKTIIALLVSAEVAHQRVHLPNDAEAEAERQKMARLRKLRLEQQAAQKLEVTRRPVTEMTSETAPRKRSMKHVRNKFKATPGPLAPAASTPGTLSEWLAQKERNGGRY